MDRWRRPGALHRTAAAPGDAKILGVYAGIRQRGRKEEGAGDDYTEGGDDSGSAPDATTESPRSAEPPVSDEAMAAAESDTLKAKVEQCKEAQDRYQRYIDSRRLFREMPDGKREYLTDKELTEARAHAKQAVIDYCS